MTTTRLDHLVQGASAGDPVAVGTLLELYVPSVRAFLRMRAGRLLLDKESASDLAQSVCRDVLESLDRFGFDGEDGFRRWLFKTAQRKIADRYEYYRAAKRDFERDTPTNERADLEATLACYRAVHTPSQHAIAREEIERVERALAELPEDQQDAIVLAKVVGLSRKAIADEMGKSEGAVRMLLHRALARLSDRLTE